MHHQHVVLAVGERPVAQPVGQLGAVLGGQELLEVGRFLARHPGDLGQEVQVVVAEHAGETVAELGFELLGAAHHAERVRPAVDQVAGQPQAVAPEVEIHSPQQALENLAPAMDVADDPGRQRGAPGCALPASRDTALGHCMRGRLLGSAP